MSQLEDAVRAWLVLFDEDAYGIMHLSDVPEAVALRTALAQLPTRKCDKCHGNPSADSGGCYQCGGSGLAKDHQPDIPTQERRPVGRRWMKAAEELRDAYQALLDDGGRVPHRMHDAIADIRRVAIALRAERERTD